MNPGKEKTIRVRLFLYFLFVVLVILNQNIPVAIAILTLSLLIFLLHPAERMRKGALPVAMLVLASLGGNLFFFNGEVIFTAGPVVVTGTGLEMAIVRTSRVAGIIIASKLLVLTVPMEDMIHALKKLFSPLNRLRLPVDEFFDTTLLTLQFVPLLKKRLLEGYRAGSDGSRTKGLVNATRTLLPVLIDSIKDPESYIRQYKDRDESLREHTL